MLSPLPAGPPKGGLRAAVWTCIHTAKALPKQYKYESIAIASPQHCCFVVCTTASGQTETVMCYKPSEFALHCSKSDKPLSSLQSHAVRNCRPDDALARTVLVADVSASMM